MAKSPQEMAATMIANLKEKTGKTMAQWLKVCQASKLEKHGQIVKHLKTEHGVTHGFANLITTEYLSGGATAATKATPQGDAALVDTQYSKGKEDLRPIYDAIITAVQKFGNDVEVSPKKAYVSLRRNKQFAIVQPTTKTRVDVGINLKGEPTTDRLEAAGSFNSMVSHRVRLSDKKEVNAELKKWLKQAYQAS
jgi:predicted transport protein